MKAAIALGCSLGPREATLQLALYKLDASPGLRLLRASRWVMSPPMRGGTARGHFWNGVAVFDCSLTPLELLDRCRTLEEQAGRRRARYWGDRTLDLDVLLMEGVVLDLPELTLPHPGIADRAFVLGPLLEVWPEAVDARSQIAWQDHPPPPDPAPVAVGVVARRRWPL